MPARTAGFERRVSSCSLLRDLPRERDFSICDMRLSFLRRARRRLLSRVKTGPSAAISEEEEADMAAIVEWVGAVA